jgi:hypothetical protein
MEYRRLSRHGRVAGRMPALCENRIAYVEGPGGENLRANSAAVDEAA